MPKGYTDVLVQCPFYRWDDGHKSIKCEGITPRSSTIVRFRAHRDYRVQMDTFCCNRYGNCEMYHAAMEKYDS